MINPFDWSPVANTTSEFAPSCGVARVTGVTDGILQIAKPNANNDRDVIVLSDVTIPPVAQLGVGEGTFDPRVIVAYDEADGTPAAGEEWGSKNGSWKLRSGYGGFRILGGAGSGLVNAKRIVSPLNQSGQATAAGTTSITPDATWVTVVSVALPNAGTYLIAAHGYTTGNFGVGTITAPPLFQAQLYDSTSSGTISTAVQIGSPDSAAAAPANEWPQNPFALIGLVTVTAAHTIILRGYRYAITGTGTWANAFFDDVTLVYARVG